MSYQIIGSKASPFVRRLRLLMATIPHEFKEILIFEKEGAALLKKINPINKVPVFIDRRNGGEKIIWDSRVIFNYLIKEEKLEAMTLEEENYLSAIDGVLDTCVQIYMMKKNNVVIDEKNPFFKRHLDRIPEVLQFLDSKVPTKWRYPAMCLYSFLEWIQFRQVAGIKDYKNLLVFMEKNSCMPMIAETKPA